MKRLVLFSLLLLVPALTQPYAHEADHVRELLKLNKFEKALKVLSNENPETPMEPATRDLLAATANLWLARKDLGQGDYSEALTRYAEVRKILEGNPSLKKMARTWDLEHKLQLIRVRRDLGRIKPVYRHRVLAIFIKETDLKLDNGRLQRRITDEQIERARLMQGVTVKFIEAMSGGAFSLDIEEKELSAKVARTYSTNPRKKRVSEINLNEITPHPSKLFAKSTAKFDGFIFYWNARGAGRAAWGGLKRIPLVPYQLYSPKRATMIIPINWSKGAWPHNTILHEFWHNLEALAGLYPAHGWYSGRQKDYPNWKGGEDELGFYRFQTANVLPKFGWYNINTLERRKSSITSDIFKANQKVLNQVGLDRLRKSNQLFEQALDLRRRDKNKRMGLYKEALQANPYNTEPLWKLAKQSYDDRDIPAALGYLNRYLQLRSGDGDAYSLRGRAFARDQKFEKAFQDFKAALALSPRMSRADKNLMINHFIWASDKAAKRGDRAGQLAFLKMAARLTPDYARLHYLISRVLMDLHRFKEALAPINKAISMNQTEYLYVLHKGKVLNYAGRIEPGDKEFQRAVAMNYLIGSKVSRFYYKLSRFFRKKNDDRKTLQFLNRAVHYNDRNSRAFYERAWYYRKHNRHTKARVDYRRAADLGNKRALSQLKRKYLEAYRPRPLPSLKKKAPRFVVGIYDDGYGIRAFEDIFKSSPEFKIIPLKAHEIRDAGLRRVNVLLVFGGMSTYHASRIGEKGKAAIQRFLQGGGGYVGICAGASLALQRNRRNSMFSLVNATAKDEFHWRRGTGYVSINLNQTGRKIFAGTQENLELLYANGPLLKPAGMKNLSSYQVLARYKSDMTNEVGAPRGQMPGTPAIVSGTYGRGRVLIFSPHPELTPGMDKMVRQAVKFTSGR